MFLNCNFLAFNQIIETIFQKSVIMPFTMAMMNDVTIFVGCPKSIAIFVSYIGSVADHVPFKDIST